MARGRASKVLSDPCQPLFFRSPSDPIGHESKNDIDGGMVGNVVRYLAKNSRFFGQPIRKRLVGRGAVEQDRAEPGERFGGRQCDGGVEGWVL